jgi:ER lumen protein retaining receptor
VRPQLLFLLWLVIEDHDALFIMAEAVHFLGIGVLLYKLITKKNAGGALLWVFSGALLHV